MPKVLITPSVLRDFRGPYYDVLVRAGLDPVFATNEKALFNPAGLIGELDGFSAVLASIEPYPADVLANSNLRVISRMGVGYDAIDVRAATARGVAVTITAGANEESVAETTIALITGVFRGLPLRDQSVRDGRWLRNVLPRLAGRTLGLVGLGRIGKAVVERAQGLGLRVIAYDPYPDQAFAIKKNVHLMTLDALLAEADIVSLHLPCTPATTDLINARSLALMKPGSVLVNTSRGGLVDEDALCAAIHSGHVWAAGLDVFKTEPLPLTSPLLQCPRILMMPHNAGLDVVSEEAMATLAAQNIADLYSGRYPTGCVVNFDIAANWKW